MFVRFNSRTLVLQHIGRPSHKYHTTTLYQQASQQDNVNELRTIRSRRKSKQQDDDAAVNNIIIDFFIVQPICCLPKLNTSTCSCHLNKRRLWSAIVVLWSIIIWLWSTNHINNFIIRGWNIRLCNITNRAISTNASCSNLNSWIRCSSRNKFYNRPREESAFFVRWNGISPWWRRRRRYFKYLQYQSPTISKPELSTEPANRYYAD